MSWALGRTYNIMYSSSDCTGIQREVELAYSHMNTVVGSYLLQSLRQILISSHPILVQRASQCVIVVIRPRNNADRHPLCLEPYSNQAHRVDKRVSKELSSIFRPRLKLQASPGSKEKYSEVLWQPLT